jgi:CubicO group peptidase (beta-lactamase class C family)
MPNAAHIPMRSPLNSEDSLDLLIDRALGNKTFPAIACGVWIDEHPTFLRYAGFADPLGSACSNLEPITGKTLFDVASLTKPCATVLLTLRANEASSIDINRTVGFYLPDINSRMADIPVHSLLTHTSGLPAIPALERHFLSSHSLERTAATTELFAIEPERTHGEHVSYSCTGYMLLGLILERISGTLLGELYQKEIAGPLRLPWATFAPGISRSGEPLALAGTAATEICGWRKRRIRGQVHDESAYCLGGHSGNAGLFATLEDVFLTTSKGCSQWAAVSQ